jgi:hypothetical protein
MSIGLDFTLSANTAGFTKALATVDNATSQLQKSLANKFEGRDLARGLMTAFGLSIDSIAEKFARLLSGMSKETEENYKKMDKLSDELTKKMIEAGRERLSLENQYQLAIIETERLNKKISENLGDTLENQNKLMVDKIALIDKEKESRLILAKINDEIAKGEEEEQKRKDHISSQLQKINKDIRNEEQEDQDKAMSAWSNLQEKVKKGKYEQMAIDKKIKSDQRELYDINEEISDLKKDNLGTGLSELRIIELQNQAYDLTLSIAENTKTVEEQRLNLSKETTRELKAQLNAIAGIGGGGQFNEASDATLREVIRRNKAQTGTMTPSPGLQGIPQANELARLILETKNAEKELKFRSGIRSDFMRGGELGARQNFAGNPLNFDQIFSQLVKGQTVAEESNNTLKTIATNIRGIIKAQ